MLADILAVERSIRGHELTPGEVERIAKHVANPDGTPLAREESTDIGNARRFAWAYPHALRYVVAGAEGSWMGWGPLGARGEREGIG